MNGILKSNLIKRVFNILIFIISVSTIVYFCIDDNNLVLLLKSIPTLNFSWLILAFLSMFLFWFLDSQILYKLSSSVYKGNYSLKNSFRVTMVGQFYNSISPYAVLGQPMQLVTMTRQGISAGIAISILIQKFLIYQTVLVCYSLVVIATKYNYFYHEFGNFMIFAAIGFITQSFTIILLIIFSISRKLTSKLIDICYTVLEKLHFVKDSKSLSQSLKTQLEFYLANNRAFIANWSLALKLYLLTFLQITSLFLIPFYIYKSFSGPSFPIYDIISAQSFITMISSYIPLPGACGVSEESFIVLFSVFFGDSIIKQAMLIWRFITYYSNIIVGIFFSGIGKKHEKIDINISELIKKQTPQK